MDLFNTGLKSFFTKICCLIFVCGYSSVYADYTFNNVLNPAYSNFPNTPLELGGQNLDVQAGTMEVVAAAGAAAYTVDAGGGTSDCQITVEVGATLSYAATNPSATVINVASDSENYSTTIFNYGTIDKGTGGSAITVNVGGTFTLSTTGAINGDITLNSYSTVNIDTSTATVDGSITSGNSLNFGTTTAVNFSTQDIITISNINLDQGNLTLNNTMTASQTFVMDAGTTLILTGGTGSLTDGGAGGSFTATSAAIEFDMSSANVAPTISMGTFSSLGFSTTVTHSNLFVAAGEYPLLTSENAITLPTGTFTFANTTYMTGTLELSTNQLEVYVNTTRVGYNQVALTPAAQQIGAFFEEIGEGTITSDEFVILNALESITSPQALTNALLSIVPPTYTKLQTIAELNNLSGLIETRIAKTREGYSAGDYDIERSHGVWIRPFTSYGKQQPTDVIQGYKATNSGIAFGMDNSISAEVTLGVAGSISNSKITDSVNPYTQTKVRNYEAMMYGCYKSKTNSYFDWIVAAGVNNYKHDRQLSISTLNSAIYSQNLGHNLVLKAIYSKNIVVAQYLQFTPQVFGQYTYLQQSPYTETSSTTLNMTVSSPNTNLFRAGAGVKVSAPLAFGTVTLAPSVHAIVSADAKGQIQEVNSQFVDGSTTLSSQVSTGRVLYQMGAGLDFALADSLDLEVNYELEKRRSYSGYSAYLNLRYTF